MDEVTLTGDEAVLANRITTIDRELAALEERTRESVIRGLHGGGFAVANSITRDSADGKHDALMAERDDLVARLKTLTGVE